MNWFAAWCRPAPLTTLEDPMVFAAPVLLLELSWGPA